MNQKTNTIKWLAITTMTIDHIGYFLFPSLVWLRLIGRVAFPCFLYTTIQAVEKTSDFRNYILRLVGTGLISILVTSMTGNYLNILFTLAIFAVSLKYPSFFIPGLLLSYFTEYSIYGFLLGWAIYLMVRKDIKLGIPLLLLVHIDYINSIQIFALLAVIPILLPFEWRLPRFPKWLGYGYYPIHQLILMMISFLK